MLNVQAVRRVPPARARAAVLLAVRPRLPPALHRARRRARRSVPRQCRSVVQCRECRAGARVRAVKINRCASSKLMILQVRYNTDGSKTGAVFTPVTLKIRARKENGETKK